MKVERLIVGSFTAPAGLFRAGDPMEERIRYPIPAYLLETESERILIDTGLNPAAIADPADYYGRPDIFSVCGLEQDRSFADQVDPESLTRVVLTHLHWDHVGGLDLVPPTVPVTIQRREWEAGHDAEAVKRNNFLDRDYAKDRELVLVDGDHDLLGDGSIELLSTPGHTPGHQSVRIGKLVLGIDVAHFASGLEDHRFPIFADDHGRQAESADRLLALRESGCTVVPGHDPELIVPGPVAA